MQNSIVVFTFSVLHWKHPFWANLVHKIKIINLSWNLVPRLIWIYRIQWLYSLFLFFRLETPFLGKLFQKIKFVSLSWNLVPRLVRICRIKWWFSLFLFYTGKKTFLANKDNETLLLLSLRTYGSIDFETGKRWQQSFFILLWFVFVNCLKSF